MFFLFFLHPFLLLLPDVDFVRFDVVVDAVDEDDGGGVPDFFFFFLGEGCGDLDRISDGFRYAFSPRRKLIIIHPTSCFLLLSCPICHHAFFAPPSP